LEQEKVPRHPSQPNVAVRHIQVSAIFFWLHKKIYGAGRETKSKKLVFD